VDSHLAAWPLAYRINVQLALAKLLNSNCELSNFELSNFELLNF